MSWNQRLRSYRNSISIRLLARKTGLSTATIRNLERGRGLVDNLVVVMRQGLGRNVAELFDKREKT